MSTLSVEWELVTRKRSFRAVHVPFLLARYLTLVVLLFLYVLPFLCLHWYADACGPSIISDYAPVHVACDGA